MKTLVMLAASVLICVPAAFAAGDACGLAGKFVGSAWIQKVGTNLATHQFDVIFQPLAGSDCEQGTFKIAGRLQETNTQESIDYEKGGLYFVGDGFLFMDLGVDGLVLGEPGFCFGNVCNVIPFTAAREGMPTVRFAGTMTRVNVILPEASPAK